MTAVVDRTVTFDMQVEVEERDGYWAGTTTPFGITVYGDSPSTATDRAVDAVLYLLKTTAEGDLAAYLKVRGVKHVVLDNFIGEAGSPHGVLTRSHHKVKVPAGV